MAEEIYLLEENNSIVFDAEKTDEWKKLVSELKLEGQEGLVGSTDNSPIPFQWMNKSMKHVYETLCPRSCKIESYNKTPIPLQILGLIKLSESEGYFEEMEVWYDDVKPDPILVGLKDSKQYILARWGAELENFEQLTKKAKERWKKSMLARLNKGKNEAEQMIRNIDDYAEKYLAGETIYTPYF